MQWKVACMWRSKVLVTFQFCSLAGEILASAAPSCDNVRSQGVPVPTALITCRRRQKLVDKGIEMTQISKALCQFIGYDGEEEGKPLLHNTKVRYKWVHVQTPQGQPYIVTSTYLHLIVHARPVPHCPMKLQGACGFRFSLAFFDALAENMCTGLTYQGVMYEGPALQTERAVPLDAANPLDAKAYWLLPQGTLRCTSARELHQGSAAALAAAPTDTEAEYQDVAAAFGYLYLGGRCDVTELLQERGTMVEERWKELEWQVPESSLSACWWLTNPQERSSTEALPHFLCKSIGILRAEQHRQRVASLGKLREELQRRQEQNRRARALLEQNAEWRRLAQESQAAWTRRPPSTNIAALTMPTYQTIVCWPLQSTANNLALLPPRPHSQGIMHICFLRGLRRPVGHQPPCPAASESGSYKVQQKNCLSLLPAHIPKALCTFVFCVAYGAP